jgi:hypothetical protein
MNFLRRFWKVWKHFGELISNLVGRIILTIFYFTIFLPFGLLIRFLGDPLAIKPGKGAQWVNREVDDQTMESARKPY